jgi:hypothetical protein
MTRLLAGAVAGAALATALFLLLDRPGHHRAAAARARAQRASPDLCSGPSPGVSFGYLRDARFVGGELRVWIDPAWEVNGLTAVVLDHGRPPGDDGYDILNEKATTLVFRVAPRAKVTVLTRGLVDLRVSRERFARLARGVGVEHVFEGVIGSPFRVRVYGDTICSLALAYFP